MVSSDFLSLMACADVMVGNSSAAIREAPSFHLPAVNIGTRQQGRLRAENVIDVNYDNEQIINAIQKTLFDKVFIEKVNNTKNPYGDGKSAKRIVDILERIPLDADLIQKRIAYQI
jgi:UDP-N-acetylglucosamine 2-epimerase (non-hydrolysing)/GDP/UDP-N,N'-diacetylbacillosamine 2-epimerase (hydrolysing)